VQRYQADAIVVGTGPGGATVARALARAGRDVLLLERGREWRNHPLYGTYPGVLLYADKRALLFTKEGLNIVRPLMVGGATTMYCGCSAAPLPWWKDRYGIDLTAYADETVRELGIAPLPPELRGAASTRVAQAAGELGMAWEPQPKFMQPARTSHFACGAKCMLGCRCGAKWTAGEYVDEAVAAGARLITRARVERVLHADRTIRGVSGRLGREPFEAEANTVIVAAGGIGTPVLLRNSGLSGAGRGMTMDITVMVYGLARTEGMGHDPPMTWSYPDDELGVLYSTLVDPWLMYPIIMTRKGPGYPLTWHRWGRTLGVMIKLKDEISGEVDARGTISKGLTATDHQRLSPSSVPVAIAKRCFRRRSGERILPLRCASATCSQKISKPKSPACTSAMRVFFRRRWLAPPC
jgi:hypothetical protein